LPETSARTLALKAREVIAELAAPRDAVAIGPGLGLEEETRQVVRSLVQELDKPMAVDADALTALAGHLELLRAAPSARCLTPHPGEMARMLGVGVARSSAIESRRRARSRPGTEPNVVLKGSRSVIGVPDGRVFVNPTGNPGMASGGTGDVLTGMLGAFLARGLDAEPRCSRACTCTGAPGTSRPCESVRNR